MSFRMDDRSRRPFVWAYKLADQRSAASSAPEKRSCLRNFRRSFVCMTLPSLAKDPVAMYEMRARSQVVRFSTIVFRRET